RGSVAVLGALVQRNVDHETVRGSATGARDVDRAGGEGRVVAADEGGHRGGDGHQISYEVVGTSSSTARKALRSFYLRGGRTVETTSADDDAEVGGHVPGHG